MTHANCVYFIAEIISIDATFEASLGFLGSSNLTFILYPL